MGMMYDPYTRCQRIQPAMPVQAYRTFQIAAPKSTHFRPATCAEVACAPYLHGWRTALDEATPDGQARAHYIRRESGRGFTEDRDEAGRTVFTFPPGQRCFASDDENHQLRLDREEVFIARGGDWRGNPTGQVTRHTRPEYWVEDFAENQDNIKTIIERG